MSRERGEAAAGHAADEIRPRQISRRAAGRRPRFRYGAAPPARRNEKAAARVPPPENDQHEQRVGSLFWRFGIQQPNRGGSPPADRPSAISLVIGRAGAAGECDAREQQTSTACARLIPFVTAPDSVDFICRRVANQGPAKDDVRCARNDTSAQRRARARGRSRPCSRRRPAPNGWLYVAPALVVGLVVPPS